MLVGVVHADAALHLADFRAAERTCQLVTQVAGRSGRGPLGGRVVVQTSTPDHPAIRAATAHDYEAFVRSELPIREALLYPPVGSVVRIVVRSMSEQAAADWSGSIADAIRRVAGETAGIRVLGPAPCPIERLRDRYRWHVQIHGPDGPALRDLVRRRDGRDRHARHHRLDHRRRSGGDAIENRRDPSVHDVEHQRAQPGFGLPVPRAGFGATARSCSAAVGDLGEGFAEGVPTRGANAQSHEEVAAKGAEGHRHHAMCPDPRMAGPARCRCR